MSKLVWDKDYINKVICGDCLDVMKDIPDNSIDLVLTDPPYGIKADKMRMGTGKHHWDKSINKWDNYIPDRKVFEEMLRISKNQIIWGGNYFTKYLKSSVHWLIWDKLNPNMSFSEAEIAWVNKGKRIRIFKEYSANLLKLHPTQKPIELIKWCLINYSKKNDLILDPFFGSGTTAVACQNLKRNFIGIEISPEYCEIARQRLKQKPLL